MTTQIEAMKLAIEALEIAVGYAYSCEPDVPFHLGEQAITALRAAIERLEKMEPDGYIEVETYEGITEFGFATSFEQGVLDYIKDKVLLLIDEGIPVPEMHVKPFYLHPPSAEIEELRKDAFDKGWIMAAQWVGEVHLLADMDSTAYIQERDIKLQEKQP